MNIFADFFRKRWEAQSEIQLPMLPAHTYCGLAQGRARTFRSTIYEPIPLKKQEDFWSGIKGDLDVILADHVSVILAHYKDGTILWLDDHTSNADFEIFVRREHLLTWFPDRVDALIELLIATKFNFWGWPELIQQGSDIRPLSDRIKTLISSHDEGAQAIREAEERLAKVVDQIQPPTWLEDQEGNFQLQFYVWTRLFGVVVEAHCFFGRDQSFRYEVTQLAAEVGCYIAPR